MAVTAQEINERLTKWKPLVVGMAYKFRNRLNAEHGLDDLIALGMVALWQAAETYDPSVGATFGTYARRVVLYKYLVEVKRLKTSNRCIALVSRTSLDAEHPDGSPMFHFASEGPDPEVALIQKRQADTLKRAQATLPPVLKGVIRDRYESDLEFVHIGDRLGVTRQRAQQVEREAIGLLRKKLSA